ncbi:tetratricopeptide repeat protein [bacterium]|nr:tetratricopeptide repeat protein [candidate division CSSED10-310 bacterium]
MHEERRGWLIGILAAGWLMLSGAGFLDPIHERVNEGNKAYEEGAWEDALQHYMDALQENPLDPTVHYNMGNVFFKLEKLDKAREEYEKALSTDDIALQANAYFNLGNCQAGLQDVEAAIKAYEQALRLAPDDEDAKFNLELIRRQLKSGPSEKALEFKQRIEQLVAERRYAEAWELAQKALQEEPSFAKLGDLVQRTKDLAEIFSSPAAEVMPV